MLNPYQILFEKMYLIQVPSHLVDELNQTQTRGRYSSEDSEVDIALANELRTIGSTVDKMIDAYELGVPITLGRPEDIREIYNALEDHLTLIKERELSTTQSLNRVKIEVDDIKSMDAFSTMLAVKYPGVIEVDIGKSNNKQSQVSLYDMLFNDANAETTDEVVPKVDMSEVINRD